MSLRIWLIRHAESTWNAEGRIQGQADPPLSARGQTEAQRLALRLSEIGLQALYSSPLQRAQQTASIIAERANLEVLLDERLQEHGIGEASGLDWKSIITRWPHLEQLAVQGKFILPYFTGSEVVQDVEARVLAAFREIRAKHSAGDLAVVSHGGVFNIYLSTLMHVEAGYYSRLNFGNTSISQVEFTSDGHISINFVNDLHHLQLEYSKV